MHGEFWLDHGYNSEDSDRVQQLRLVLKRPLRILDLTIASTSLLAGI